jgi:triacylglycerol esterase/lipase EstA (alpha/beta hydrolase family)
MIGRIQRALLLGQLLLAIGVATWLVRSDTLETPLAIVAGLLAPLALHTTILTADFLLAWAGRGARPGDLPPAGPWRGLASWLRAWAVEIVDSIRTFSYAQPLLGARAFEATAERSEATDDVAHHLPVLLIHGYFCNRAVWRPMAARLAARRHAVDAVDLEPPFASIDTYAPRIAAAVDALRARTGAARVALVCHSMGGLAARAYLRACGDSAVACVVTLGTPHRGTLHASLGQGANARQMRRDCDWLCRLAAEEPPERLARFTVIFSWQDNIVAPHGVQTLPGAHTVAFSGIGHVTLAYDRRVAAAVFEALDTAAAQAGAGAGAGAAEDRSDLPAPAGADADPVGPTRPIDPAALAATSRPG